MLRTDYGSVWLCFWFVRRNRNILIYSAPWPMGFKYHVINTRRRCQPRPYYSTEHIISPDRKDPEKGNLYTTLNRAYRPLCPSTSD